MCRPRRPLGTWNVTGQGSDPPAAARAAAVTPRAPAGAAGHPLRWVLLGIAPVGAAGHPPRWVLLGIRPGGCCLAVFEILGCADALTVTEQACTSGLPYGSGQSSLVEAMFPEEAEETPSCLARGTVCLSPLRAFLELGLGCM